MSGKAYENAALALKDLQECKQKAAILFHKASDCYQVCGSADRACDLLDKAGQMLEGLDSLKYFQESIDLYRQEDRLRFSPVIYHCLTHFRIHSNAPLIKH